MNCVESISHVPRCIGSPNRSSNRGSFIEILGWLELVRHSNSLVILQTMPVLQANILVDFPELKLVFLVLEGWIDWLEFLLPLANTQLAIELLLYPRTY